MPQQPAAPNAEAGRPDPLGLLDLALQETGRVVTQVRDDQWQLASPCEQWDVAALVDHLADGHRRVARQLGVDVPEVHGRAEACAAAGELVARALRAEGALDTVFELPAGRLPGSLVLGLRVTDTLVHGWDVARATAQHYDPPEEVAAWVLAFSERMLGSVTRQGRFAEPAPVPDDARALDRVVALLGRAPGWRPG